MEESLFNCGSKGTHIQMMEKPRFFLLKESENGQEYFHVTDLKKLMEEHDEDSVMWVIPIANPRTQRFEFWEITSKRLKRSLTDESMRSGFSACQIQVKDDRVTMLHGKPVQSWLSDTWKEKVKEDWIDAYLEGKPLPSTKPILKTVMGEMDFYYTK